MLVTGSLIKQANITNHQLSNIFISNCFEIERILMYMDIIALITYR